MACVLDEKQYPVDLPWVQRNIAWVTMHGRISTIHSVNELLVDTYLNLCSKNTLMIVICSENTLEQAKTKT